MASDLTPAENLDRLAMAAEVAASSLREFVEAYQAGVDHDVAQHPDLAEVNVQLDGFYE